ncbi:hypothetical protein V6N12_044101 [Hibiscus sabdariffa]|uniref:Uncharacterized protein n=1 Tax=Hibiscus sabdariffa TaxID=183260 RepID=A0ABR2DG94_9ROSI
MGDCTDAAFLVRRGLYEGFGSRICEGRVWQFYYRRRGRLGRPSSSRSTVSPLPLGVGGLKQSAQQRQDCQGVSERPRDAKDKRNGKLTAPGTIPIEPGLDGRCKLLV